MNDDVYVSPNVWKIYTVSYLHYTTIGTIVGIVVGLVVSFLFPTDEHVNLRLLSPCIRKFMYPEFVTTMENHSKHRNEEYRPVTRDTKL